MQTGEVLKSGKEAVLALRYLIAVLIIAVMALFAGTLLYYQGGAPAAQPIAPPVPPAEQPAAPPVTPPAVTPPAVPPAIPPASNATSNVSQPPVLPPAEVPNASAPLPPTSNETTAPAAPAPPVATTPTESPFVPPASGAATPPGGNATNATVQEFSMNASNFLFNPNNITVSTGYTVRLTVTSQSGTHNINIGAPYSIFRDLPAFQPAVIEFTANQSGTFEFWSSAGSDRYLGMNGTLNVVG